MSQYNTPAKEFMLGALADSTPRELPVGFPTILLCAQGDVEVFTESKTEKISRGGALFLPPSTTYSVAAGKSSLLIIAQPSH